MTTASTRSQSSSAASDGVRSPATSTTGPGSRASEGASALPRRLSWTRPITSSRSVLRSRRYASRELAEELVEALRHRAQRPLRVHVLVAHERGGAVAQQRVVEHQEVRVEDVGVGRPDLAREALLDRPQLRARRPRARASRRPTSRLDLRRARAARRKTGAVVALHDEGAPHRDARRDARARAAGSRRPPRTRPRPASRGLRSHASSSSPSAVTSIVVPCEAAEEQDARGSTCRPSPARPAPR